MVRKQRNATGLFSAPEAMTRCNVTVTSIVAEIVRRPSSLRVGLVR